MLGALEWIPPGSNITIRSDSQLTVRILEGQYKVKANPDIWAVLRATRSQKRLSVSAEWLRGHAGDPGNELADRLSKLGAVNGRVQDLEALALEPPRAVRADPPELVGLEPRGDWERDFLRSLTRQLRGGRALSEKQQAVVDRMRAANKPGLTGVRAQRPPRRATSRNRRPTHGCSPPTLVWATRALTVTGSSGRAE